MEKHVSSLATRLVIAMLLFACLGSSFGRTLVEMPAWRVAGAEAWAAFSRSADLGNGKIVYPVEAIGGTLLIVAAAIAFRLGAARPRSVAIPLYGSLAMHLCVLLMTTQAAPIMLSLHRSGNDPAALQRAFEGFYRWDSIRAIFVALGCCANIWALVALLNASRRGVPESAEKVRV